MVLILFIGLAMPSISYAGLFDFSLSTFVIGIFKMVAYIFNWLFGLLFMLGAWLVDVMMKLNSTVLDPSKNTIVGVGWPIARDIANLGLVIVMIIIAVATIVRYREYGAKKLLPKLIAAAIIVNFSLTIMAAFVNFSNVVTNFFTRQGYADSGGSTMTSALADAFGPQKFLLDDQDPTPPDPEEEVGALTTLTTGALSSIAGLAFTCIFTLLAAFVFLAFAFLLLLRFLYLTFLAILSPLIWLFWVFPPLQSQYTKWWDKFIKWTFFAPAASFFMYLALASVKGLAEQSLKGNDSSAYFGMGVIGGVMQQGVQMIIVAGVMIGGLLVAESMGIAGAGAAVKLAKGAGKGIRKFAGQSTMRGLQAVSQTKGGQAVAGVAGKFGGRLQKMGKGFSIQKPEYDKDGKLVKPGDSGWKKAGKIGMNIVTGASGLRANASVSGSAFTATGKGMKGLASREKIKPGSLMGNMLKSAVEGAGWIKKKEKEKEPMKYSEKKKELEALRDAEQQGNIDPNELNRRRTKVYSEMDSSETDLVNSELDTLHNERDGIEKDLANAKASKNKDEESRVQEKVKTNQKQIHKVQGMIEDKDTAEKELQRLLQDKKNGVGDNKETDRQIDTVWSRYKKEEDEPTDLKGWEDKEKELQTMRDGYYAKGLDTKFIDDEIRRTQGQTRRASEFEKKRFDSERKLDDRLKELNIERDNTLKSASGVVPAVLEAEIDAVRTLRTKFEEMRSSQKPQGVGGWQRRIDDLNKEIENVRTSPALSGLGAQNELEQLKQEAETQLSKQKDAPSKQPNLSSPSPEGFKQQGSLYTPQVPERDDRLKKDENEPPKQ